jgi:uncharacterized membrane protein
MLAAAGYLYVRRRDMDPRRATAPGIMRFGFALLALCSLAIYGGLVYLGLWGLRDGVTASGVEGFLQYTRRVVRALLFAGLAPAILATYFWLVRREPAAFMLGFAVVGIATVLHYFVAAIMAHSDDLVAFSVAVAELLLCAVVVVQAKRHRKALGSAA